MRRARSSGVSGPSMARSLALLRLGVGEEPREEVGDGGRGEGASGAVLVVVHGCSERCG